MSRGVRWQVELGILLAGLVWVSCGDAGSVEGAVRQSRTETPVAGAEVRLGEEVVTTDDQGLFRLEGLDVGSRILSVSQSGYRTHSEPVSVEPGRTTAVVVTLEPLASGANGRSDPVPARSPRPSPRPPAIAGGSTRSPASQPDEGTSPSSPGFRVDLDNIGEFCNSTEPVFLCFSSQPGDYVGGGRDAMLTPEDGTFHVSRNFKGGVTLSFDGAKDWNLSFAPPDGEKLVPGRYTGATRFGFHGGRHPGLSFVGDGKGCNTSTGRFDVLLVQYSNGGEVLAFAADFEQYCDNSSHPLVGRLFLNVEKVPAKPTKNLNAI